MVRNNLIPPPNPEKLNRYEFRRQLKEWKDHLGEFKNQVVLLSELEQHPHYEEIVRTTQIALTLIKGTKDTTGWLKSIFAHNQSQETVFIVPPEVSTPLSHEESPKEIDLKDLLDRLGIRRSPSPRTRFFDLYQSQ